MHDILQQSEEDSHSLDRETMWYSLKCLTELLPLHPRNQAPHSVRENAHQNRETERVVLVNQKADVSTPSNLLPMGHRRSPQARYSHPSDLLISSSTCSAQTPV